jgi:ubiquinone/menaquinone biosynthesis C-methylase UbiE
MRAFLPILLLFALFVYPSAGQQFSPDSLAPYVPSPQAVVDKMLASARVKPGEVVYDLGCGDGRVVITAAQKFKARAVGVELSGDLYRSTLARVHALGLEDKVRIVQANALRMNLSPADVVTLYLLTSSNERLKPNLEKYLRPGARVVSHDFEFRGWKPTETVKMQADGHTHTIYVYEMGSQKLK